MNRTKDSPGKNIEKWLTASLLVAFLLNTKKVLLPNVLIERGLFNEYLDISIYLFDGVFLLWFGYIIIRHRYLLLSIYRKMFHLAYRQAGVEHSLKSIVVLIAIFILWHWLSVIQAEHIPLAIRSALTMTEIGIFVLVQFIGMFHACLPVGKVEQSLANEDVPRGTRVGLYRSMLTVMTYFALFNSIIVFIQISTQHSIGLQYLGESFLQVGNPGIATITIFGEKIIRAPPPCNQLKTAYRIPVR